jgi:hypothetical protein
LKVRSFSSDTSKKPSFNDLDPQLSKDRFSEFFI